MAGQLSEYAYGKIKIRVMKVNRERSVARTARAACLAGGARGFRCGMLLLLDCACVPGKRSVESWAGVVLRARMGTHLGSAPERKAAASLCGCHVTQCILRAHARYHRR